jgi:DNA polymerase III subunit alpha
MRRRGEVIDYVRANTATTASPTSSPTAPSAPRWSCATSPACTTCPYAEADRLAKMIPDELNISSTAIEKSAELQATRSSATRSSKKDHRQGRVIEGMVRNTGKHAAGIIITDQPLDEFVPLTCRKAMSPCSTPRGRSRNSACSRWTFSG